MQETLNYLYQQCHRECIALWGYPTQKHQSGKEMIQFAKGQKDNYLQQVIISDQHLAYLHLTWWANTVRVYLNSELVQSGDLFDQKCRIPLVPDQKNLIEIHLDSPNHDCGALMQSVLAVANDYFPIWQDLTLIDIYIKAREVNLPEVHTLVNELESWFSGDRPFSKLQAIHQQLLALAKFYLPQQKVYLLGNSHIDIAWLWTITETKEVLQRTFNSVINLQSKFPELIFHQTSAVTYQWIEEQNPLLFQKITQAITQKTWEITGGMWVEPDCNIPSGESLIRQILYGKKYFQAKFSVTVQIAWLPDSFGFNGQLPQILVKSGFDFFLTQKLSWNDTHKFPYDIFYWQGVDGSQIFTYFTNLIGESIDPIAIAKYLVTQDHDTLWLYGVGDHGGGPTADMLEIARKWQNSPLCLQLRHSRLIDFLVDLKQAVSNSDIPTWQDELYLEFHRGTYTSKADQKYYNRQSEVRLANLEKLSSIYNLIYNKVYPKQQLDHAWQLLLVNQFHDIITGSSIPEVFQDANQSWQKIAKICDEVVANLSETESENITVWNLSNWHRAELLQIPITSSKIPQAVFINSTASPYQILDNSLYLPVAIPALSAMSIQIGYDPTENIATYQIPKLTYTTSAEYLTLENQFIIVNICNQSGCIEQIIDKRYDHQLLTAPIEWQFFQDRGQYWDAWNIDPNYYQHKLAPAEFISSEIVSNGELLIQILVLHQFQDSLIKQEISLSCFDAFITVKNTIDWQEEYVLAKIAFPTNFTAEYATYEIPMGTIRRKINDPSKWEVPAQYWADMSSLGIGLAVINDCKYGYSAKPKQISLTALRSPQWTCPQSDRQIHKFSYYLVPHNGSWQSTKVPHLAQALNNPLLTLQTNKLEATLKTSILLTTSENIILSCFKQSYDQKSWIIRFYEAYGLITKTEITVAKWLSITSILICNLMEEAIENIQFNSLSNSFSAEFTPYEIKTFQLDFIRPTLFAPP